MLRSHSSTPRLSARLVTPPSPPSRHRAIGHASCLACQLPHRKRALSALLPLFLPRLAFPSLCLQGRCPAPQNRPPVVFPTSANIERVGVHCYLCLLSRRLLLRWRWSY